MQSFHDPGPKEERQRPPNACLRRKNTHKAWIEPDRAGEVANDLVRVRLEHLFIEIVLAQERHIIAFDDRNADTEMCVFSQLYLPLPSI